MKEQWHYRVSGPAMVAEFRAAVTHELAQLPQVFQAVKPGEEHPLES
jgi:hypothetical protein